MKSKVKKKMNLMNKIQNRLVNIKVIEISIIYKLNRHKRIIIINRYKILIINKMSLIKFKKIKLKK